MKVILSIDAGGTYLKSALIHPAKGVVEHTLFSCPANSEGDAETVQAAYRAVLRRQMGHAASDGLTIERVGIDIPGPFDYAKGVSLMRHKYRAIYGVPLAPWIHEIIGNVPVCFLHDSTAFILGEKSALGDCRRIAGVMIGTGLGFALMEGGHVLLNEIGGPLVSLFKTPYRDGIAEDYVSARGIVNRYNQKARQLAENAKEVAERIAPGDERAESVYADTGFMLAEILKPVLRERKTEALVVGGQIAKSFELFGNHLRRGLSDLPALRIVRRSEQIDIGHLLGAAMWDCSNVRQND